jgi:acyl carrier protein phosphodiesterase
MNFVAHSHVALLCAGAGREQAFGAALPDIASMAGARVDRSLLSPAVEAGVALHLASDKVFHALEAFRHGAAQIRDGLLEAGVPTGPARAVGHAGYELLLDGCLLARPGIEEEFGEVLAEAPDVSPALSSADPGRFAGLVASMRDERWWCAYRDPHMIARALHRRLLARRLLRLSEADLPAVARVLTAARPAVEAATDGIVAAVIGAVDARGSRSDRTHLA